MTEQKEAIKKIRQDAAAQAQAIKKRMEPVGTVTHELYKVNYEAIIGVSKMPLLDTVPELKSTSDWSKPFLLSTDRITMWLGENKVQEVLTKYAGSYQKEMTKQKIADSHGRTQQRIDNEIVIKSAQELMKHVIPKGSDISGVDEQCLLFMTRQWLYGFMPAPDMAFCGFPPNNAACAKIMASGQVKVLAIQLSSLVAVSKEKIGPACESLSYIDGIRSWDDKKIQEMCEAGVRMFGGVHSQGQMIFIPQGWIIVEVAMVGSRLLYGYRNSFMQAGEEAKNEYACAISLYKSSARNTERMESILECMNEEEED